MDSSESSTTNSSAAQSLLVSPMANTVIPPQLKFLMSNMKSVVNLQLTTENHSTWRAQILKLFTANGFHSYLDGSITKPPRHVIQEDGTLSSNPLHATWVLIDQNLAAALYSTISSPLLPYVLTLDTCAGIWLTIERRFQSTNRSRVIQLKNELHHIQLKDRSIQQYLSEIKAKVDAIALSGSSIDPEDIILYTLNGLPTNYHAYKTAIRTNLQPLSLDDFYSLLCSEELHLTVETVRDTSSLAIPDPQLALNTVRGRGRVRSSGSFSYRGRFPSKSNRGATSSSRGGRPFNNPPTCQICNKIGHIAPKCWYRGDFTYQPNQTNQQALLSTASEQTADWFLDSGASAHLTADPSQLQTTQPYQGNQQIFLGNGQTLPIAHTGHGILPTLTRSDQPSNSPPGSVSSRALSY